MRRRHALLALAAAGIALPTRALPARTLVFPRDHGSHPGLRTEWWYLTGRARAQGRVFGFQITFFRVRVDVAQELASAFAARQLLFAHAALSDIAGRRLLHDQRIARAGFGVAEASEADTAVTLRDWSLARQETDTPGHSRYAIHAATQDFALELQAASTQPLLLQGEHGLSRKGPRPAQASYYVSQPQLAVSGAIVLGTTRLALDPGEAGDNRAWMDHEWSEELLAPEAVGWDWIGMNLLDGGALTAFVLRRQDGSALWAGGSLRRAPDAPTRAFSPDEVRFTPLRIWTSPLSGARYPVRWQVGTPVGQFTVAALLDDQELDSRASTGAIYWEGLSTLHDATGRTLGHGYLEMTGYASALRLG